MKQIIKKGFFEPRKHIFQIECEKCGCEFLAEEEDTTIFHRHFQYRAVACPCCETIITNEQNGGAIYWTDT